MSSSAQLFAQTVLNAFRAAGHHTDKEVGDAGGPSTTTMTSLRKVANEGGSMPPPRSDTLKKIDAAARWRTGSARALWEKGEEPKPAAPSGLAAVLGKQSLASDRFRLMFPPDTMEEWIGVLADRILEVEERLDLIEQRLATKDDYALVAHDEEHDIEDEQGHDEHA